MPETKVVQVTGRGSNVNLAIDDAVSFQEVLTGLRAYLGGNSSLYSQGVITVNVGRRMLEKEQLTEIKELLERESGVTVSSFWCPPDVLQEALSESVGFGVEVAPGDAYRSSVPPPPAKREIMHNDPAWLTGDQPSTANDLRRLRELGEYLFQPGTAPVAEISFREPDPAADLGVPAPRNGEPDASENGVASKAEALSPQQPALPGLAVSSRPGPGQETENPRSRPVAETRASAHGLDRGNEALLIKTNCRSGMVISYPGDIVVMADVNPGAEIIADGDILVFGRLRGFAHAGAAGDRQATIVATHLEAHRLQIGPYTGIEPAGQPRSKSKQSGPRIAYVRRQSVFVAPYTGRFGGYGGGILYDG